MVGASRARGGGGGAGAEGGDGRLQVSSSVLRTIHHGGGRPGISRPCCGASSRNDWSHLPLVSSLQHITFLTPLNIPRSYSIGGNRRGLSGASGTPPCAPPSRARRPSVRGGPSGAPVTCHPGYSGGKPDISSSASR